MKDEFGNEKPKHIIERNELIQKEIEEKFSYFKQLAFSMKCSYEDIVAAILTNAYSTHVAEARHANFTQQSGIVYGSIDATMYDLSNKDSSIKSFTPLRSKTRLRKMPDADGWVRHHENHLARMLNGSLLNYWPSKRKWQWNGINYHGCVDSFINIMETATHGEVVDVARFKL